MYIKILIPFFLLITINAAQDLDLAMRLFNEQKYQEALLSLEKIGGINVFRLAV
jgi:hypothetical protein